MKAESERAQAGERGRHEGQTVGGVGNTGAGRSGKECRD